MIFVKSLTAFILIYLISFSLLPLVKNNQKIEEYRPEEFKIGQETQGSISLFAYLLEMTLLLIVLKLLKIPLSAVIDLSVFFSGFIFGSIFGMGLFLGLVLLGLRKIQLIETFNIASIGTIVSFSLLLAKFITPHAAMLLLALLSVYDVLGVLYFPYIKFLWLETRRKIPKNWFTAVAIISDKGMVGAGDFALPLLFSLSFGFLGILSAPLLAIGFWLNQILAKRFGAFPGIPIQAFFAYFFYIAFA